MEPELVQKRIGSKNTAEEMRELNAIAQEFADLQNDGYKLYSISVTYKARSGYDHSTKQVNEYFNALYFHEFLPKHLFKDKRWIYKRKHKQPYVYVFLEAHKEQHEYRKSVTGKDERVFPKRLHHHGLIAVAPEHVKAMDGFLGLDTMLEVHPSIKTSKIDFADLNWLGYAGKDLHEFRHELLIYAPTKASLKVHEPKSVGS